MEKLKEIVGDIRIVVNRMKQLSSSHSHSHSQQATSQSNDVNNISRAAFTVSGELKPEQVVRATLSSLPDQVVAVTNLPSEINLYHSMMDKEGTDGEQDIMKAYEAAHEEIDDSTDGASSALITRDYDEKVTYEEFAPATASTTGVHLEKTPTGPTLSSNSVGSPMVLTLEKKRNDQPTVSSSILSSVSNSDMSLVGDYLKKYNYAHFSPALLTEDHNSYGPDNKMKEQENLKRRLNARIEYAKFLQDTVKEMAKEVQSRSGELKKTAEDLDDFLRKVRTGDSVANDEILGFAKLFNDQLTLGNISRPRLVNMCKYMGIQPCGTDTYLRYMLRKRLQWIKDGDKMVQSKGGVDALSEDEVGENCRERGMFGLRSVEEMRQQLRDWLDLSLNHSVPFSLLILSRATLPDKVVGITSLPSEDSVSERQEELIKEKEEQVNKKKQSVESNKDVTLEEMINATAADAQQQLCKVSEALVVLASASSVSREREEFLKLVKKEINLHHSMMDKEGTEGEQDIMKAYEVAHEEIDEHVLDGASSALINRVDAMLQKLEKDIDDVDAMRRVLDRDYDRKVTSEEFAPATASTTGVHLEKTPTGPTPSSSSVPSGMVPTQKNKPNDQTTVPCSKLSSVSNSDMSLVGDYHNKYKYGPEDHNASKVEERPAGISFEDDWRRRMEQRLLAQEASIRDLSNCVGSRLLAQEASIRDLSNCVGSLEETVKKHMTELSAAINVLIVKNKPSSDVFQDGESSSRVVDEEEEDEEDSPPPPVTQAAESMNHFSTPESETAPPDSDTNTTADAQTSSGIQYTPGVLHDDEDEDHFPSVFEQAAGVLDDDEDEDHFSPVFEQATSEERPTGVSESDVEEEEEEEEKEEDSPVIQEKRQMKERSVEVTCRGGKFEKTMRNLQERWSLLKGSPFYKLLRLDVGVQDNKLIELLVSVFNTEDKSLQVDGCECEVTPQDFIEIMGVEDGDEKVIITRGGAPQKPPTKLARLFLTDNVRKLGVSATKVMNELSTSKDKNIVMQAYALFALGTIICAPSKGSLAPSYLKCVHDLSSLKKKQWATHAIKLLVQGINSYKNEHGSSRKTIGGCTIFLQLYVMKKMSITVPKGKLPVSIMSMIRERLKECTDSSRSLNKILVEAQTPTEVLEGISEDILAFQRGRSPSPSPLNLETAIYRIATLMDETSMTKFQRSQFARRNMMIALVSMAMTDLHKFSAESITRMAWALPKIGESRYGSEIVKVAEVDAQFSSSMGAG